MERFVTVIGGINIDVKGQPQYRLINHTSNPGRIYISPGGVGRNIAHNLALLGVPVYLFSAVGNDGFGHDVLGKTRQAGVQVNAVRLLKEQPTGMYVSILEHQHDLAMAISDMEITRWITPEYLAEHRDIIKNSSFVILETNLELETLRYAVELCRHKQIPFLIEPVSVEKAKRIHNISGDIQYITPNVSELEILSAQELNQYEQLEFLCASLGDRFQNIVVTLGKQGVYHYCQREKTGKVYASLPTEILDANGAGDAFVAGFVCGLFHKFPLEYCSRLGIAAACLTLLSEDTVNKELSFIKCQTLLQ